MEFANMNWLAVATGTVVAFLMGWLVYSPAMFGKGWAEGSGVELTEANKVPVFAMITQILALMCLAIVIGATASANALFTAILAILAAALFTVSNGAFCKKSGYALGVDCGYIVGAGLVMIAAQALL